MNILEKLENNLKKLNINKEKDSYSLGFSAGPDSTFLLYSLYKLGYKNIACIYINYHDSDFIKLEEEIVYKLIDMTNFKLIRLDTYSKKYTSNFEQEARIYRYTEFSKINRKNNFKGTLIAHHEDDLLVTYLMQKEKKAGVNYFGLKEENTIYNVKIYRPLLNISRKEIIDYLKENNVPYYDDITNYNLNRTRNYFREKILPNIDKNKILLEIKEKNKKLEKIQNKAKNSYIDLNTYHLLDDENKKSYLFNYLKNLNILKAEEILTCRNLIFESLKKKDTKKVKLNNDFFLYKDYDFAFIDKDIYKEYIYELLENKEYDFDEFSFDTRSFNLKEENFPLKVVNAEKDMVFSTNIINNSVWNFLKKQKVPSYLRDIYPVFLNCQNKICYVPFYKDIKENNIKFKIKLIKETTYKDHLD